MRSVFSVLGSKVRRNTKQLGTLVLPALCVCVTALALPVHAAGTEEQASTLTPQIVDLRAMTDQDIGPVTNVGTIRSKTLVKTPNGTVAIQSGDAPKHTHQTADEIQYVISGTGTFWLGDTPRKIHAGDLIIIPKGTVHAGSHANSGHFKVIAIKLPPQAAGDIQVVK